MSRMGRHKCRSTSCPQCHLRTEHPRSSSFAVIRSQTKEGLPEWLRDKFPTRAKGAIESNLGHVLILRVRSFRCPRLKELPASLLQRLVKLRTLDLDGSVSLKELPAEAGLLTDLRRISLEECHALHTPPPHIVMQGHDDVLHFLRDLAVSGSTPCHLVKLEILGNEKAGKSILLDSLVAGRVDNDALWV